MTVWGSEPKPWFRCEATDTAEDEPTVGEVYIYAEIGETWWGDGLTPKALVDQIGALDVDELRVFVNSPGGSAWDGITIMNALRRHRARVVVTVDGLAASAASLIAMAGDRIIMNRASEMMIHDSSGYARGPAETMRETADVLDRLSDSYADGYAARAGGDRAKWRAAMRAETWYTAEEAVLAGLADEWVDAPPAAAVARFDLSGYRYQGRAHAPAPLMMLPASEPGGNPRGRNSPMKDESLAAGLRARLGAAEDLEEQALLALLDERLQAGFQAPAGTQLVDAVSFAELQQAAEQGRAAIAAQVNERRERMVAEAVGDGRIAPAARAAWRAQLDTDEDGVGRLLASLPKNTVPVEEIGYSAEQSEDDQLYAIAWGNDEKGA